MITFLKVIEYQFVIKDYSIEMYGGIMALLFTIVGIWLGQKLVQPKKEIVTIERVIEVPIERSSGEPFELDTMELGRLGISKREYEVLTLIAKGMSNQEIADNLFVSLNTVKTHSSRLFEKLDVNRRVQAVEKAKSLKIIS
jgi:ATP/maltotriose-dependent transcriptional regulator MalT